MRPETSTGREGHGLARARGGSRAAQPQARRESAISMRRDWLTAERHWTRIGLW